AYSGAISHGPSRNPQHRKNRKCGEYALQSEDPQPCAIAHDSRLEDCSAQIRIYGRNPSRWTRVAPSEGGTEPAPFGNGLCNESCFVEAAYIVKPIVEKGFRPQNESHADGKRDYDRPDCARPHDWASILISERRSS